MINDIKKFKCKRCQSLTKKSNQRIKCKQGKHTHQDRFGTNRDHSWR